MPPPLMNVSAGCSGCAGKIATDRRTLCVRFGHDLDRLLRTFGRYDSIYIGAPVLSPEERRHWEHRLSRAYTECGCDAGAIAFLTAVGLVFVRGWIAPQAFAWSVAAIALGFCVAMAIAGKIMGMVYARFRLWQLVGDLRPRLG